MIRERRGGWMVALGVLGVALVAGGRGYVNGDAAAYAAQGWAGDLAQRPVHFAWIALANGLAPIAGAALPRGLDAVHALFAALAVAFTAHWAARAGGNAVVGAIGAAASILPWAPFAEVDVPWVALATAAVVAPARAAALCTGLAVATSPAATLAIPWIALARARLLPEIPRDRAMAPIAVGLVVAVVALTVGSGGDWWFGDRGVLGSMSPTPLRALRAWGGEVPVGLLPLVLLGSGGASLAFATLPLLLAPADTASVLPLGLTLAVAASRGWQRVPTGRPAQLAGLVLAVQLAQRGLTLGLGALSVAEQDAVLRRVAADLGPDDAVVAPFTWGARLGVIATGDPYGIRWRPPDRPLRDQGARWCAEPVDRVAVLPPGTQLGAGTAGALGVWWTRGDDPALAGWCADPPVR